MLNPVILDHSRSRAFSTARKQRRPSSTPSPRPFECVCVYVCVSCSARAQDDHFQDTTFSIASGFTLASLRNCSYTRPRFDLLRKAKRLDLLEHTIHRFLTLSHLGRPDCCRLALPQCLATRIRTINPSKMMSRSINNLPAHGAPSRDDFAKLDERQRDQINDVVCCLTHAALEPRNLACAATPADATGPSLSSPYST